MCGSYFLSMYNAMATPIDDDASTIITKGILFPPHWKGNNIRVTSIRI